MATKTKIEHVDEPIPLPKGDVQVVKPMSEAKALAHGVPVGTSVVADKDPTAPTKSGVSSAAYMQMRAGVIPIPAAVAEENKPPANPVTGLPLVAPEEAVEPVRTREQIKNDEKIAKLRKELAELEEANAGDPYPVKPIRTAGSAPEEDEARSGEATPAQPLRRDLEREAAQANPNDARYANRTDLERAERTPLRKAPAAPREAPETRQAVTRKEEPKKKSAEEALKDGDKK